MKQAFDDHDPNLDRLSLWLKNSRIQPPPDFLNRVRQRLQEEPESVDQHIDRLLAMDRDMNNPNMVHMVRARLQTQSRNTSINWFSWLAPLAAAATLTLAFISFQAPAPDHSRPELANSQQLTAPATQTNDPDLTLIFALAANLHSSADMSKLQSVEDLASLFD